MIRTKGVGEEYCRRQGGGGRGAGGGNVCLCGPYVIIIKSFALLVINSSVENRKWIHTTS